MKIQEDVSLKELTTMKIGGTARYFCSVGKAGELAKALAFAHKKGVGYAVLGGGSNVLITEAEFPGLLIKIDIKGVEWKNDPSPLPKGVPASARAGVVSSLSKGVPASARAGVVSSLSKGVAESSRAGVVLVVAGAGESWDNLVAEAVKRGLWGIENLSGIPGTVGAAPIQNIGAYGTEIQETLAWMEVFDTKSGKFRTLSNKECEFSYRDSVFKHKEGQSFIVTRVALRLNRNGTPDLEYKDLKEKFRIYDSRLRRSGFGGQVGFMKGKRKETLVHPVLADIRRAVLEIRSRKFPDLRECGTAGSFFKNPIISRRKFNELKKRHPALPGFELKIKDKGLRIKVSLAWVLDNICDLKGYAKGNVRLFEHQPIVLVQNGSASCTEVEAFAKEIAERVKEKTGIEIEWEVQRIR